MEKHTTENMINKENALQQNIFKRWLLEMLMPFMLKSQEISSILKKSNGTSEEWYNLLAEKTAS